jgi:hypothetical protein
MRAMTSRIGDLAILEMDSVASREYVDMLNTLLCGGLGATGIVAGHFARHEDREDQSWVTGRYL